MAEPLKTFICYAHEDRSTVSALRKHLNLYEKKGILEIWDDGQILAGQDWDKAIKIKLETAQLILLFVSVDFINSDYIEKTELQAALQRHRNGLAKLIPIIVRRCVWEDYFELGNFQALPPKAKPIFSYELHAIDEAYHDVATGIRAAADEMLKTIAVRLAAAEQQAATEAAQKQQAAAAAKRQARQKDNDETAWQTALFAAETAKTPKDKIVAYEVYLDEDEHQLHRTEAEAEIKKIKAAETARKIKERQQAEQVAELDKQKREAAAEKERQAEAARLAELLDKQKREAAAEKERQAEAARLAELKKQQDSFAEMVLVKGGTFQMGSNDYESEKPIHSVTLDDFFIGKYPVTQKQWQEIMGSNPAYFKGDENLPVEQVSWDDIQEFLQKLNKKHPGKNYRLPTEAEWEYAASGGELSKGCTYAGSSNINEVAWYHENSDSKTHRVGSKKANELGIFDMSGNVWEWCSDWYGSDYYKNSPSSNPQGPDSGSSRVCRGGSWNYVPRYCRVAVRRYNAPGDRYFVLGFRVARTK